jgi:hypothetical protein
MILQDSEKGILKFCESESTAKDIYEYNLKSDNYVSRISGTCANNCTPVAVV